MHFRKVTALIIAVLVLFGVIIGLKEQTKYPALEFADPNDYELAAVVGDTFSVSFPAKQWDCLSETEPMTLYYTHGQTGEGNVNINIQQGGELHRELNESDLLEMKIMLRALSGDETQLETAELRKMNRHTVIYIEQSTQITEEIAQAAGNEEIAGRTIYQIGLGAIRSGYCYFYTGTYFTPAQKDIVLKAMTIMAQTTEQV